MQAEQKQGRVLKLSAKNFAVLNSINLQRPAEFKILKFRFFLDFEILKFVAADLDFKSRRADMKRLATTQAEEVAADLACRARVHEWKVGRALKASSGVLRSRVVVNLWRECSCRTPRY